MYLSEAALVELAHPPVPIPGQLDYAIELVGQTLTTSRGLEGVRLHLRQSGSTANGTNIDNSDIDLVVSPSDIVGTHIPEQCVGKTRDYQRWQMFRGMVLSACSNQLRGATVTQANKCISIVGADGLPPIDLTPSLDTTSTYLDLSAGRKVTEEGMVFWTSGDDNPLQIVSHPGVHRLHGEDKDIKTGGLYTAAVRAVKAIKHQMIDAGDLDPAIARSHHVECSVYNLGDDKFEAGILEALREVANTALDTERARRLVMASHRYRLLGGMTHQWPQRNAETFYGKLLDWLS